MPPDGWELTLSSWFTSKAILRHFPSISRSSPHCFFVRSVSFLLTWSSSWESRAWIALLLPKRGALSRGPVAQDGHVSNLRFPAPSPGGLATTSSGRVNWRESGGRCFRRFKAKQDRGEP